MRPVEPLFSAAGMSVFLKGQSRRLARFGEPIRGATGMDSCGLRISRCVPPAPPNDENPPGWGQTERKEGGVIGFYYRGCRGVCQKPVDCTPKHPANPHGSKQKCPTGIFQNPRVWCFYPRVYSLFPRVCFPRFPSPPLSISLFSLRKESEREESVGMQAIHGFFSGKKSHPRVCYEFDSYSVDEEGGFVTSNPYRSMTCAFPPVFPRSTGKNAYVPHGVGSQ